MTRISINRGDYLFVFAGAAFSGLLAVGIIALVGGLSAVFMLAAVALILVAAAIIAIPLALDMATIRDKAASIVVEGRTASRVSYWTPLGGALASQLQNLRYRIATLQGATRARSDDAERVIDALAVPLFVLDVRRRIVQTNQAAEELFGGGLVGRNLSQVLRNPGVLRAADACLASGGRAEVEFELIHPVARNMEAHLRTLPMRGSGDDALLLTLQDLTAARQAEQMRVDLVANVSHELRTPLTSLGGFIETMQTVGRDDEPARYRFLGIMAAETQRMNHLVEDLLSLSRIEIQEHEAPVDEVELGPVVSSVVTLLGPMIQAWETTVELYLPTDLPSVIGDESQLTQVTRNLLENAIKYGRPGGRVQVRASDNERQVSLAIQDDGEGIPPELQFRLTERFFRMEKARSSSVGGTGLGLAIVKHIVNRHRGRLQIESDVGKGSTFTVHLPVWK